MGSGQSSVGSQKQRQKLTKQKLGNPEFLVGFERPPSSLASPSGGERVSVAV